MNEHNHSKNNHNHIHEHDSQKNIGIAFILNAVFVVIEIVGGLLTNSIAILSDAVHDLGDSLTLGLSWILEKRSQNPGNSRYTYGYKRLSLVGALMNAVVLLVGSGFIIANAIPRIFSPEPINAKGMFILAIIGIIINGAAVIRLKKGTKIAEKVVSLHLLEDVLGWAAVLIVSIILIFADIPILDPILSLFIAAFVLKNVVQNFGQIIKIFLQAVPEGYDIPKIEAKILKLNPDIYEIHGTKLWTLDGESNIMTFHMCVKNEPNINEIINIKRSVKNILSEMGIEDVTIEIENSDNCSNKPIDHGHK